MIEKYEMWGHVWREWGYEIRIDFYIANGNIENMTMTFPTIPLDNELQTSISMLENDIIFRYNNSPQEMIHDFIHIS